MNSDTEIKCKHTYVLYIKYCLYVNNYKQGDGEDYNVLWDKFHR
jgi:hypothetical protein